MIEVIKYAIPSLIVLLATWIVMYKLFQNEQQKREWELKKAAQKEISPIRLRAYERLRNPNTCSWIWMSRNSPYSSCSSVCCKLSVWSSTTT